MAGAMAEAHRSGGGAVKMTEARRDGGPTAGRNRRPSMRSINRGSNCVFGSRTTGRLRSLVEVVDFNSDLGDFVVCRKDHRATWRAVEADRLVYRDWA